MRRAMAEAVVGDDVLGDEPPPRRLDALDVEPAVPGDALLLPIAVDPPLAPNSPPSVSWPPASNTDPSQCNRACEAVNLALCFRLDKIGVSFHKPAFPRTVEELRFEVGAVTLFTDILSVPGDTSTANFFPGMLGTEEVDTNALRLSAISGFNGDPIPSPPSPTPTSPFVWWDGTPSPTPSPTSPQT